MKANQNNNIAGLNRAKEALLESEENMRYIIKHDPNAIAVYDINLHYIAVSERYLHDYDVREEDIIGKHHYEVFPEMPQKWKDVHQRCLAGATEHSDDDYFERPDGSITYNRWECRPWHRVNGEIGGIITYTEVTTERKKAENALKETNNKFIQAQRVAKIGSWENSLTTNDLQWSEEMYHILGFPPNTPINLAEAVRIFPPEEILRFQQAVSNAIDKDAPYSIDYKIVRLDGSVRYIHDEGEIIRDEKGKAIRMIGTTQDITERRLADKQIAKLSNAVEQSADIVFITNWEGIIEYLNPAFETITGYSKEEALGNTPRILKSGLMDLDYYRRVWETILSGKVVRGEVINKTKNGDIFFYDQTITPLIGVDGKVTHFISTGKDITERKRSEILLQKKNEELTQTNNELIKAKVKAEELLAESQKQKAEIEFQNERLEGLLRVSQYQPNSNQDLIDYALTEAINLTDSKIGYVYYYSETKKQFTLKSWSNEVMKECSVLNPRTVYDLESTGCWGEAVRQRKPIVMNNFEDENLYKKGTPYGHVQLSKFLTIPIFIDNDIVGVVGVANKQDDYQQSDIRQLTLLMDTVWRILERERIFKNLKEAKNKAEESDHLKSAFLANMSHEVRTPLNSIIGFSELLIDPFFEEDDKNEFIQHIINNGKNLLTIISDIMDISKMESGEITIRKSQIDAQKFISGIKEQFGFQTEAKKLELKLTLPDTDEETIVFTDVDRLSQIFNNLISNALKFTENGIIEIGYQPKGNMVEFFIRDTGIGIPAEFHDIIFERFRQIEGEKTRKFGGNGLGLAISKNLVELMGGKIWIESEKGKGSCFCFTIPA